MYRKYMEYEPIIPTPFMRITRKPDPADCKLAGRQKTIAVGVAFVYECNAFLHPLFSWTLHAYSYSAGYESRPLFKLKNPWVSNTNKIRIDGSQSALCPIFGFGTSTVL